MIYYISNFKITNKDSTRAIVKDHRVLCYTYNVHDADSLNDEEQHDS